jgi:hypothetical protein
MYTFSSFIIYIHTYMNKRLFTALLLATLALPMSAAANIKTLGGSGFDDQVFATSTGALSPHIRIVTSGSTHTFEWDGSPWTIAQGGTGSTSFTDGAIPFITSGVFSQNTAQLFWNSVSNALNIGGIPSAAAKLTVMGTGDLLNLANSSGASVFSVNDTGQVVSAGGMNITSGCYAINGVCLTSGGGPSGPQDALENFESYPDDVLNSSNGGTGWLTYWTGNSKFVIQSAVVSEGTKAMQANPLQFSPTFFQRITASRTLTPITSGTIHFDSRTDDDTASISFEFSSGFSNAAMALSVRDATSNGSPGPHWLASNGTSTVVLQPYTVDQFDAVDIEFDTATDLYRVSIDGGAFSSWFSFSDSVKNIDKISINTNGPGVSYIDDIRIEQ